jgi:hypothetical protein
LKNIFLFSKSIAEKCYWILIKTTSLWTRVVYQKYIAPLTTLDWIQNTNKTSPGISIIWKYMINSFDLIGNSLVWRVGSGRSIHLGMDPWPSCKLGNLLHVGTQNRLAQGSYYNLVQVGDPIQTNFWHQGWLSGHRLGLPEEDLIHWGQIFTGSQGCLYLAG